MKKKKKGKKGSWFAKIMKYLLYVVLILLVFLLGKYILGRMNISKQCVDSSLKIENTTISANSTVDAKTKENKYS